mmetsp:Transcript_41279/g.78901  ORF Transcript_41279/g.78901 Transcript_41279/m.78901 type:complete len:280 (-) Transcript_41279:907-1746(-)
MFWLFLLLRLLLLCLLILFVFFVLLILFGFFGFLLLAVTKYRHGLFDAGDDGGLLRGLLWRVTSRGLHVAVRHPRGHDGPTPPPHGSARGQVGGRRRVALHCQRPPGARAARLANLHFFLVRNHLVVAAPAHLLDVAGVVAPVHLALGCFPCVGAHGFAVATRASPLRPRLVLQAVGIQVCAIALVDQLDGAADAHAPVVILPHFHHLDPHRLPLPNHALHALDLLLVRVLAAELDVIAQLGQVHQPPPLVSLHLHKHPEAADLLHLRAENGALRRRRI